MDYEMMVKEAYENIMDAALEKEAVLDDISPRWRKWDYMASKRSAQRNALHNDMMATGRAVMRDIHPNIAKQRMNEMKRLIEKGDHVLGRMTRNEIKARQS